MMRSGWWGILGVALCACTPQKGVKPVGAGSGDVQARAVTIEFPVETPHMVMAEHLSTMLSKCWATSRPLGGGNVYIDQQFRNAQVIEFIATQVSDFGQKSKAEASRRTSFATLTVVALAEGRTMVTLVDVGGSRPATIDSANQVRWWTQGRSFCAPTEKSPAEITLDSPPVPEAQYLDVVRGIALKSACEIKGNITATQRADGRIYQIPCAGRTLKLRCRFDQYTRLNDWGVPFTYDPKIVKDQPACVVEPN